MISMPRRKQDAPQRLKYKNGIEQTASAANDLQKTVEINLENNVTQEYDDSLNANNPEVEPEESCNRKYAQKEIENRDKNLKMASEDTLSVMKSSRIFTENRPCDGNENHVVREIKTTTQNAKDSNRDLNTSRDDTSSLHTLAAAAEFRSTTPGATEEQQQQTPSSPASNGSSKMAESSMPIKKRGKRSSTPEEVVTSAASKTITKNIADSRIDLAATNHAQEANHMISQAAKESMSDVAQQHASQLHLMEAMMQRQRQLYEDCTENNWMKMQRTDNNCLSKSKAKRYRWCVQKKSEDGSDENNNNNDSQHHPHNTVPCTTRSTERNSYPGNMKKNFVKRQANPMHDKLYGTVFTGASKFRCRDCGNPFNTLVDLTLHMNKTGHYRDQNIAEIKGRSESGSSNFIKPKKRSVVETEEKESAEKVLKCLGCGHSFDSLQDLTVHMIKTKHYEDVPSLRFYSQKNDFCTTNNSSSQPDKTTIMSSQHMNNNVPNGRIDVHSNGQRSSFERQSTDHTNGLECQFQPPMFGGFSNFANMQALAAQSLFGFSPYMMPTMGFPGAINAYGSSGSAFAAAAASLLLSAPWLMQVPGFGANMFPSYFNTPATPFPPTPFTHTASPRSADEMTPPLHSRSASPPSRNHQSPMGSQTPNEPQRYKDENTRSKSQVLCCSQCGKSFNSLQKLTNHMREAAHFPNASTPPIDVTSFRRPESSTDSPLANHLESPRSKQHSPTAPYTSSPLEHLAKLASGKSLGQLNGISSTRSRFETPPKKPHLGSLDRYSPAESVGLSKEKYIQPENKESSKTLTGFDFIKSLETTIQSAISKVNEPTRSPIQEKKMKKLSSASDEQNNHRPRQYVFNHYVPTHDGKRLTHQSKSQSEPAQYMANEIKKDKRPASDGEEYEQKKRVNYKLERQYASPPLDLSRSLHLESENKRKRSSDTKEATQVCKKKSNFTDESNTPTTNPLQCIKDRMHTWFDSNSKTASKQANDVRRTSEDDVSSTRSSLKESYPPLLHNHNGHEKSNPLQEMQKIVNSTELTRRPESLTDVATKDERRSFIPVNGRRKRSFETENNHKTELKRYKPGSVLSDLVRHENDSPPTINPLAQMEHLVNLKIGENAARNKSSSITMHSNKPNPNKLNDDTTQNGVVNGTNPMTALLSLFRNANHEITRPGSLPEKCNDDVRRNGEHDDVIAKPPKKAKRHREQKIKCEPGDVRSPSPSSEKNSFPPDETARLRDKMADFFRSMMTQDRTLRKPTSVKQEPQSPGVYNDKNTTDVRNRESKTDKKCSNNFGSLQELQLQIIFTSNFENISKKIEISDVEMERLSSTTELSINSIKEWIARTQKKIVETGGCNFMKLSKSKGTPKYRCTSCPMENLSATDFLQHISTHINSSIKPEFNRKSNHEESNNWKMSYRGAMRFEPLKPEDSSPTYSLTAHVTKSPMRDFSTSPASEVSEQRSRCVDGMKVTEDSPIQVSG